MVATKTWAATASIRSDDRVACIVLPSPCTIFIIFHFVRVLVAKRIIISKSIKCNRLSFVLFVFPKLFFSSQESKRNHFFFIHRILTRRTCTFIEFATFYNKTCLEWSVHGNWGLDSGKTAVARTCCVRVQCTHTLRTQNHATKSPSGRHSPIQEQTQKAKSENKNCRQKCLCYGEYPACCSRARLWLFNRISSSCWCLF